jgi:hypothetical protein
MVILLYFYKLNNQIIATSRQLHHLRISFSIVYTQGLGGPFFFQTHIVPVSLYTQKINLYGDNI